MKSILALSQVLPYPPDTGVHVRTHNTWKILANEFNLRALCFHRSEGGRLGGDAKAAIRSLSGIAEADSFPLLQDDRRWRLIRDHLWSLQKRRAYTIPMYQSAAFTDALSACLASRDFDLIQLESLDLATYLPYLEGRTTVCIHHNVESELLGRRADHERNPILAGYMRHQSRLMRQEEQTLCPKIDLNFTVSERDRKRLQKIAPTAHIVTAPNGVDTDSFRPTSAGRRAGNPESGIVSTGGTMYFPNRDALSHFERDIWPRLRARDSALGVTWVGRATPKEQRSSKALGIELTGRVPDVRPFLEAAACFILPLRIGGGTRLKLLEAWAMGKAVVTTSIGCEGTHAVDGKNCLIRDDPGDFADAVESVLKDENLRKRLGDCGRDTVERDHSWTKIGRDMLEAYRELLSRKGTPERLH